MLRKIGILATLLAAVCFSSTAQADVFVTGQTNINGAIQNNGTGLNYAGARNFGLGSNGISFTNFQGAGAPGSGGVITAVGFAILDGSANVNGGVGPAYTTSPNLVGVYALRGVENGAFGASFNEGVIQVFDRSLAAGATPAIFPLNPSSWTQGNDIVAQFNINNTPINAVLQGPPGGVATEPLLVPNPGAINDAEVDTTAGVGTTADFLFSLVSGGLFTPLGGSDDFFIRLNQLIAFPTGIPDQAALAALVAQLNDLFDDLMTDGGFDPGNGFSYGNPGDGTVYNPLAGPNSGDTVQTNTGGLVVPGQVVPVTEIPEPASLIVWSVLAAGGAGLGMIRRRRNQA